MSGVSLPALTSSRTCGWGSVDKGDIVGVDAAGIEVLAVALIDVVLNGVLDAAITIGVKSNVNKFDLVAV